MKHNFPIAGKAMAMEGAPLQVAGPSNQDSLIRQVWLQYFNDYLREREVITEDEWRKIRRMIGRR